MARIEPAQRHAELDAPSQEERASSVTVTADLRKDASAAWHLLRIQPGLVLACLILALAVLWALVPGIFTVYDPIQGLPGQHLRPPTAAHLLGTDSLGRDLFARIVYGAVHSLSGALAAVGIALVAGTTLGLLAGSFGGRIETVIMRLVDVMLSIPDLLLSLSIIVLLGFGTVNAAIAVGCTLIAKFARLVRSEVVTVRRSEYVEAAFGSGGTFLKVLWRHILPNSLASVIAFAALQAGWAILQLATLGFLGYGAPPPTPEWGLLIAEGRNYIATAWWLTAAPGLVVVLVVISINRISRALGSIGK
ncbi:ABC transporter permease [Rhizobium sp. BK312]|uniref:ABC transporter permease n=1 Tax=Rhizobium sp. BK312 TaxID=2587080 RepID=UPI000DD9158E|nr:ABC transporter permease [Rhizobium sp. BK312]